MGLKILTPAPNTAKYLRPTGVFNYRIVAPNVLSVKVLSHLRLFGCDKVRKPRFLKKVLHVKLFWATKSVSQWCVFCRTMTYIVENHIVYVRIFSYIIVHCCGLLKIDPWHIVHFRMYSYLSCRKQMYIQNRFAWPTSWYDYRLFGQN